MLNSIKAEDIDTELRPYTMEEPIIDSRLSDEPIFSFPLSSWAYYHKLHQMEWIAQLGFELDVYQADELAGMYWYVFWFLLNSNAVTSLC